MKKPAGTSVRVTVTPYNGSRKGRPASLTTTLPDLTPPTGAFRLDRSGSSVTVTQTALSDDVSPAADITRKVTWGDGTVEQAWTSGSTIGHVYAARGAVAPDRDAHRRRRELRDRCRWTRWSWATSTAPTGSFSAGPAAAWAAFSRVGLTQLSIHDDVQRRTRTSPATVQWGDGTVSPWPSGAAAEHVYAAEGTYTPSVVLTDEAGNVATVASSAVTVTRDTVAPSVKLRVPRTHRTSARSWRFLQGRATDAGTGVALVRVGAVEKRGARWYGYRPGHGWVKAPTQAAAWRRARAAKVAPASTGEWLVPLQAPEAGSARGPGERPRPGPQRLRGAHPQPAAHPPLTRPDPGSGVGHALHVEGLVELLLGELAALDVAQREHGLADRGAVGERLLGDLRGVLVADVLVERGDDRRRGLGVLRASGRRRR